MIKEKRIHRTRVNKKVIVNLGVFLGIFGVISSIVVYVLYSVVSAIALLAITFLVDGTPVMADHNVEIIGSKLAGVVSFVDHTIETSGRINKIDLGKSVFTSVEVMVTPEGIFRLTKKGKVSVVGGVFFAQLKGYQGPTVRFFLEVKGDISYCLEGYDDPLFGCDIRKGEVLIFKEDK